MHKNKHSNKTDFIQSTQIKVCPIFKSTIGIVLCRDKNNAVVEMTLPEDNKQIFAGKYETVLPSKEALQKLLKEQMEDDEN